MNEMFEVPVLIAVITSPVLALHLFQEVMWARDRRLRRQVFVMAMDVMFEIDEKFKAIEHITMRWQHEAGEIKTVEQK